MEERSFLEFSQVAFFSLLVPSFSYLFSHPTTDNRAISKNNFAAALGLPRDLWEEDKLVPVPSYYGLWRLRQQQWRFLHEESHKGNDPAKTVVLWEEEHQ